MTPQVSVIVPFYLPEHLISKLDRFTQLQLTAFEKYTTLSRVEFIYVCNGVCATGLRYLQPWLSRLPIRLLWFDQGLGYTRATNEGIRASRGDYLLLFNDDAVLLDQSKDCWLDWLLRPFEVYTDTGITGIHSLFCPFAEQSFIVGYCMLIKRKLMEHIGMLDEVFSPGAGEDTDLCARARLHGYKVVTVDETQTAADGHRFMVGTFPIWHEGEASFHHWESVNDMHTGKWQTIFDRNSALLRQRTVAGYYQAKQPTPSTVPVLTARSLSLLNF